MADHLKITGVDSESERLDTFGREHSEKLQSHAKQLVSSLYMLVRSAKLYDPANSIFEKPLEVLRETINTIIAADNQLVLQAIKDSFYLNNMLVKMDFNSLDNVRSLIHELKAKKVGGFALQRPVSLEELRNFIWIFSKEQEDPDEDGLTGRKLVSIKLSKWKDIKEKIQEDEDAKVDRKKYAVTVYARTVLYMRKYLDSMRSGEFLSLRNSERLVQDLVDICYEQRSHFLGMTTMEMDTEYLVFHSVNVALISVVFGSELGLNKTQLKELGLIALFHDIGMATLDDRVTQKRGALDDMDRKEIEKAPLTAVQKILERGGISRSAVARLVATIEHHEDFGTPVKDAKGNVQMIIPRSNLSTYSKILSIANTYDALTSKRPFRDAYGPDIALTLMWTEMRHKFDPDLLKVFMRVMAIAPVRILPAGRTSISLG